MSAPNLIAVFVENKPGQTARITKILADADVNIRWVTIANSGSFGVMKFLVDKRDPAVAALKAKGLMVSLLEVLAVEVPNRPGALQAVADCWAGATSTSTTAPASSPMTAPSWSSKPMNCAQARALLEKQGLRLLSQEELLKL